MVTRLRRSIYFEAPGRVEVRTEGSPSPSIGEVRVQSICSAISAGTELLILRGEAPPALATDESLASLTGTLTFPLKYGYASVGIVTELGPQTDHAWLNRRVFAFNPHETEFVAPVASLIALPNGLSNDDALFLPNMETAVSLVQDGHPFVGERVAVLGAGVVGLLSTALLARTALAELTVVERLHTRRLMAASLGAMHLIDPDDAAAIVAAGEQADLVFELTGSPGALNMAITIAGFAGRVVIGSWYGIKSVPLDLGGRFHRSRIQLISSQVSTLAPQLLARWSKTRRLDFALSMLTVIRPSRLISHRIPFESAQEAYALVGSRDPQTLQVVLAHA